jgi:predicted permease
MSDYFAIFLPIYFPILLGFFARITGYFSVDSVHALNRFCLRITIPLLMFTNMADLDMDVFSQVLPATLSLPVYMAILWIVGMAVSWIPFFRKRRVEGVLIVMLGNIGYFGWAVTDIGLGEGALSRSLMFATLFWPTTIFYAVLARYFTGGTEEDHKAALRTLKIGVPIIGAFVLGGFAALLKIEVPPLLMDSLTAFGSMTTPLILFGVGLSLSFHGQWGELAILLPLRLALGFGAAWITTHLIGGLDDLSRTVILTVSVMPVGANSLIMGEVMGLDGEFLARAVTLSTVLALVTIPMTLMLLA